jgi:hypothetical protein
VSTAPILILAGLVHRVSARVTFNSSALKAKSRYRLEGTSPLGSLSFRSETAIANGPTATVNVVADDPTGTLGYYRASTIWKLVLNPGQHNQRVVSLGQTSALDMYVTYGSPDVGGPDNLPTDTRMRRALSAGRAALARAQQAEHTLSPSYERSSFKSRPRFRST